MSEVNKLLIQGRWTNDEVSPLSPMEARASKSFSPRSIITTFSFASSATLVAIAISTLTNKLLSVSVGPEGIGLMGLFRNFGSFFGGILTFGYTTILVQQISKAREPQEKVVVAYSGFLLFFVQIAVAFGVGVFFIHPLSHSLFQNDNSHYLEIRVVIAMALVNILLQIVTAILRGQSDIKGLSFVQILTAVSSLVLIFPIIQLGNLGLAINVGSGSVIGSVLGLYLVKKNLKGSFQFSQWREALSHLKQKSTASTLVTIQTLLTVGSLLFVQTLIQKMMGLEALGNYNAALLILDTGVLVMMSSVRSYLLPTLSQCKTEEEKKVFFQNFFVSLLCIALIAALSLYVLSPWIIRILFSSKFVGAEKLLSVFGLSLLGLSMVWVYNTLLLHFEKNLAFTVIDCVGAGVFIGISYFAIQNGKALENVVWAYVTSSVVTTTFYLFYVGNKFGIEFVTLRNKIWPILGFLSLMAAILLEQKVLALVSLATVSYQAKLLLEEQKRYDLS